VISDDNLRKGQYEVICNLIMERMHARCQCADFGKLKHLKCPRCADLFAAQQEFSGAYMHAQNMFAPPARDAQPTQPTPSNAMRGSETCARCDGTGVLDGEPTYMGPGQSVPCPCRQRVTT